MKNKLLITGVLLVSSTLIGYQLFSFTTARRTPQSSVFQGYCVKCLLHNTTKQLGALKDVTASLASKAFEGSQEEARKLLGVPKFLDVCDRTPAVQNAILKQLNNKKCSQVTKEDLQIIEHIDVANKGITSLKEGDLSGMPLRFVNFENNQLEYLPPGLLAGQTELEGISFRNNNLKDLPDGMGDDLNRIEYFSVYGNRRLRAFPKGFFINKEHIHEVNARNTRITFGEIERMSKEDKIPEYTKRRISVGFDKAEKE